MSKKSLLVLSLLFFAYIGILFSERNGVNLNWGLVKIALNFTFLVAMIYYLYGFFKLSPGQTYTRKFVPILFIVALIAGTQFVAYFIKTDGGKTIFIRKEYQSPKQKQLLLIFRDSSFKLLNIEGRTGTYYRGQALLTSKTILLKSSQTLPQLLFDLNLPNP
ncbi:MULTISPECIES: hypothetical protein [unclassified Paraflavitalea]|uniref:hypothetical protein n=1 Tax=unclassified Paraflavitalea TaxID=2798305 RepID=UPI003D353CFC